MVSLDLFFNPTRTSVTCRNGPNMNQYQVTHERRWYKMGGKSKVFLEMTYHGNSLIRFILLGSNGSNPAYIQSQVERKATVLWPWKFKWGVNKVMMHGIAYLCQRFKLLLFEACCSHNISVTLQAVQTQRRLHINESAFHLTLHVLHTKVSFSQAFSWISCSQIK